MKYTLTDDLKPIAYENLRTNRDRWGQSIAFCLPEEKAFCNQRKRVTELGCDTNTIQEKYKEDILSHGQQKAERFLKIDFLKLKTF